ncbi:hypothetical protein TWF718_008362 [Orbilia javanica]|uniref:F-box domain-containing protein n=1 Tax=Orbilia javanica TaxID=47235 RepID=A0AAN8MWP5_9PEZI
MAESQALFDESFAECEIFCRFYIHISKSSGLSSTNNDVPAVLAAELTRQYILWANPPTPLQKESAWIPDVSASELRETHDFILRWSKRFLDSYIRVRYSSRDRLAVRAPVESFAPPTNSEITRIARAFYQLFLSLVYFRFRIVDPMYEYIYDDDAISDGPDLDDGLKCAIVETINCLDYTIIQGLLLDFIGRETRLAISAIKNMALVDGPQTTSASRFYYTEWHTVGTLGPQRLWEFLFGSSIEKQKEICARDTGNGSLDPYPFIGGIRNGIHSQDTYPPFIRICRDELVIGEGDVSWWDCRDLRNNITDAIAVVWDDWRLKEWGYLFPMIKLPLYLPGQTPFHRFDCELSTPVIPYKEGHKRDFYRNMLFHEMSDPASEASDDDSASFELLRVGDVLGENAVAPPTLTHPLNYSLPIEIQLLILEVADYSQYTTLRAVCKSWKTEAWKILKSRYTELPLDLQPSNHATSVDSQLELPVLIHSALLDFKGHARGRIDNSKFPPVVEFGKIYSRPDPDDPLVLTDTERLRAAADYPIIIPKMENPEPFAHSVCAGFNVARHFFQSRCLSCVVCEGERPILSQVPTVKELLATYFKAPSYLPNLRSLPPHHEPFTPLSVQVTLMNRLEFGGACAPPYIRINFEVPAADNR